MNRLFLGICLAVSLAPLAARDLAVAREGVSLQARCGEAGPGLAALPEGHTVSLRFSIAGADTRCYSVRTEVDGEQLSGYIERDALAGIETVEQERRDASASQLARVAVESIRIDPPPATPAPGAAAAGGPLQAKLQAAMAALGAGRAHEVEGLLRDAPADDLAAASIRSSALLRLTRPGEAQAALDPALRAHPNDPSLLGLAGVAAFQQDRIREAKSLLERSVKLRPNPTLEKLLARIQTEQASDESDDKAFGSRFVLRYDGDALPQAAARSLAAELDRELPAVSTQLGCQIRDRLTVVVKTRASYQAGGGVTSWAAGHYDGRIHVALEQGETVSARVRETIKHELVHACLARRGDWPSWVQEGLAQYVSGRRLASHERQALAKLNGLGKLPSLEQLSGSWARLDGAGAQLAYGMALAAAELLFQESSGQGPRNLLANPASLPSVTEKLDRRLRETLR
jgi:hypothetical protein